MTSLTQAETRIIDICPPGWCWSRLGQAGEGILSWATRQGRVTLTVPYAITHQQIAMSLAASTSEIWLAADREATLEVTDDAAEDQRWVVRATGPVHRAGRPPARDAEWLILQPIRLRGFYETSIRRARDGAAVLAAELSYGLQR